VVASPEEVTPRDAIWAVLIPFIAGQWSLRGGDAAWQRHAPRGRSRAAPRSFPSLRGSGRFGSRCILIFSPRQKFQSPSLRGSGRFCAGATRACRRTTWRFNPLHCGAVVASRRRTPIRRRSTRRFNPLHCGAVVASADLSRAELLGRMFQSPSLRGSGRFGAPRIEEVRHLWGVSIPFIAGQWSLLAEGPSRLVP